MAQYTVRRRIDQEIRERFRNCATITVQGLAESLGMSRYQLARRFRDENGRTISEYLRECQFRRAKELLETTGYSIKRVALLSGCGTNRTLRRLFIRFTGVTPSRWRRP